MATSRLRPDEPDANTLAIAALSHFATDPKTLDRFFALTGLDAETLRQAAGSEGFTAGVLDFVLSDEALLRAIAAEQEIDPEAIAQARARIERHGESDADWPPRAPADWA